MSIFKKVLFIFGFPGNFEDVRSPLAMVGNDIRILFWIVIWDKKLRLKILQSY
jgi:hypothetical protein